MSIGRHDPGECVPRFGDGASPVSDSGAGSGRAGPSKIVKIVVGVVSGSLLVGLVAIVAQKYREEVEENNRQTARAQIKRLAQAVDEYTLCTGNRPQTLEDLGRRPENARMWPEGGLLKGGVPRDPWGNEYQYRLTPAGRHRFEIVCYGADGREGGENEDADISYDHVRLDQPIY